MIDKIEYAEIFEDSKEFQKGKNTKYVTFTLYAPSVAFAPYLVKITSGYRGCDDDVDQWGILSQYVPHIPHAKEIRRIIQQIDAVNVESYPPNYDFEKAGTP